MTAEVLVGTDSVVNYADYAVQAAGLVKYDDEGRQTIGGVPVLERLHLGVLEEWGEVFGGDSASVEDSYGYSRVDALRGGLAYTNLFRDTEEGREQIKLHVSEFGDSLWYVTNYLHYFGISLEDAMADIDYAFEYPSLYSDAMLESHETISSHPVELGDFIESGRDLFSHMGSIFGGNTVVGPLDETSATTLKQLTRQYVESMTALASATFGVSLEDIMVANIQKISGRWKNGTVLGSGDKR